MAGILGANKVEVLKLCKRHCALCERYVGMKMEVHHIIQKRNGGSDDIDNLIPLCFDCHAEVGSYNKNHPKGNKYSPEELKYRRDSVYEKVKEGALPIIKQSASDVAALNDYERRIAIEKDFRPMYGYILNDDLRNPMIEYFELADYLIAHYQADSFFCRSELLEILDRLFILLAFETSPGHPVDSSNKKLLDEIFNYRKSFVEEYQRMFFI